MIRDETKRDEEIRRELRKDKEIRRKNRQKRWKGEGY